MLILIGLLSAVALPRMVDRGQLAAPVVADAVAQALRYGRAHAVASGCPVQVILASSLVSLHRPDSHCVANFNATVPLADGSGSAYTVQLQDNLTIATPATLVFDADGSLQGASDQTLTVAGFTVIVNATTGYVQGP